MKEREDWSFSWVEIPLSLGNDRGPNPYVGPRNNRRINILQLFICPTIQKVSIYKGNTFQIDGRKGLFGQ